MQVWDGRRPLTDRTITATHQTSLQGLNYRFVSEAVMEPTDWCFQEPHHTFVIHRRGTLTTMEIEFQHGPSGPCLPRVGDVWVIPAGHRYAALAQGATVGFCEVTAPTSLFGDRGVPPRVGYHDILLHRLIERLAGQIDQPGPIATLFRQTLADTTRLHIAEHYGARSDRAPRHPARTLDERTRSAVVDYLNSELDRRIDLGALAAIAGMPVHRFLAAFSAAFATTPHQLLIDLRIQRAKALLITTDAPVAEIGTQVGFATPSHFATSFKRRTGVSPTDYRDST
jgi:AraC family transcriptional regulator